MELQTGPNKWGFVRPRFFDNMGQLKGFQIPGLEADVGRDSSACPTAENKPEEEELLKLRVTVDSLPQGGNVINDPPTVALIQSAGLSRVGELTLVDGEGQEMIFRFPRVP